MSLKDLQNCEPTSPFYPYFIPTGQEVSLLLSKVFVNSSSELTIGAGTLQVFQAMDIPLTANVVYFNCQFLAQSAVSMYPAASSIHLADIDYSGATGNMSWFFEWGGLVANDRPNVVCTILYFL